jgi:hypothetical protein
MLKSFCSLAVVHEHLPVSPDGVWICSYPFTPKVELSKQQKEQPITYHTEAIDEALEALSNVGIAIRQSSRVTETAQARKSLSERPGNYHFALLSHIMLETLYPSAPETLLLQLRESPVNRYARHLYRVPVQEALEEDVRAHATSAPSITLQQQHRAYEADSIENMSKQSQTLAPRNASLMAIQALPSIRSSQFSMNLRAAQNFVHPSPTLVRLGKIYGPPVPEFDTAGKARCGYCFHMIDHSLAHNGRWSPMGM